MQTFVTPASLGEKAVFVPVSRSRRTDRRQDLNTLRRQIGCLRGRVMGRYEGERVVNPVGPAVAVSTKVEKFMASLEFYFDCSSPWTYLAFSRVHDVAKGCAAEIVWKPILVGGVFNAVNKGVYEQRANPDPIKMKYYVKDLADWAKYCGIEIGMPEVFPVRAVLPMRGAIVAQEQDCLVPYAWAVFEAYWGDLKDISQEDVLSDVCRKVGLDPDSFFERCGSDEVKAGLKKNTDELIERGGFGSPTMFIGDDMYFGNDRLPLVEAALRRGGDT